MALDLLRLQRLFGTAPPPFRLTGKRTELRAPERLDWQQWAELRSGSRNFLAPWEPSWSDDALSRAAFRRRLARYALEWHSDQGYTFLLFRREDEALLGALMELGSGVERIRFRSRCTELRRSAFQEGRAKRGVLRPGDRPVKRGMIQDGFADV